jgi:hypothetical protein
MVMLPERRLWQQLNGNLGRRWDAWPIETGITGPGVSDVFILNPIKYRGWLELKVGSWGRDNIIKTRHFTLEQRSFLLSVHKAGMFAGLLLSFPEAKTFWLLTTPEAFRQCGELMAKQLDQIATWHGNSAWGWFDAKI